MPIYLNPPDGLGRSWECQYCRGHWYVEQNVINHEQRCEQRQGRAVEANEDITEVDFSE